MKYTYIGKGLPFLVYASRTSFSRFLSVFLFLNFFGFFLFSLPTGVSASTTYEWTNTAGGAANVESYSMVTDSNGDVIAVGEFSGTVDLDPSGSVDTHVSAGSTDVFTTKYDATGAYEWSLSIGNVNDDLVSDVTVDAANNIYVIGSYFGTVDFDPSGGTDNHTSGAGGDAFLTKYDTSGNYQWTVTFGDAGFAEGYGVAVDGSGNIYITGAYAGTVDFDPGAGTDNETSVGGAKDAYISKFNSTPIHQWTVVFGGTGSEQGSDLDVDSNGDVYVAGEFDGTVDFDDGVGVDNHTADSGSDDGYLTKYNTSGVYQWTTVIAGTNSQQDRSNEAVVDSNDDVIVVSNIINSGPERGMQVLKLNSAGTQQFSFDIVGNNLGVVGVALDVDDSIYTAGFFDATADFDPSAGVGNGVKVSFARSFFVAKYDSSGNFEWVELVDDNDQTISSAIHIDPNYNVFVSGIFENTVNFNTDGGTDNHTSAGNDDLFIIKLDATPPAPTAISNIDGGVIEGVNTGDSNSDITVANVTHNSVMTPVRIQLVAGSVPLAQINVDLTVNRDWGSLITGNSDAVGGQAFVHSLIGSAGADTSFTLYVPKLVTHNKVTICPGATSLAEVSVGCSGGVDLGLGSTGQYTVTVENIGGTDYWAVAGATGTGGLGTGAENASVYIDLDAQPATAPSTISTAPEVAVSTSDNFYLSYIPSTTEFAASDSVDIAIPFDWSGLTVCAGTGDADGAGGNDHTTSLVDSQIIRYTFTGVTTTALATGVEFCFTATTPVTPGNYNIPFSDTNDGDYGPALIYVGDDNDVTVTATIPITLSLRIKEPSTTADTNICALGVLNPGSVNTCSYRIAAGTNISTGLQVFTFADNQLNTAGDSADIDDTAGGTTVTAGVEEHGVLVTLGTGWTVGGSFSISTDEAMPVLTETLILDAAASISDSDTATWSTIVHSASVNSGTSGGSYDQLVTYRAWVDT